MYRRPIVTLTHLEGEGSACKSVNQSVNENATIHIYIHFEVYNMSVYVYELFLVRCTLKERDRHARVRKFTNTAS